MAEGYAQMVLDERLFLEATRFLAGLEEKHELLNVVGDFAREPYVVDRFEIDLDRDFGPDDQFAIEYYVGAVYLVHHHRASLEGLDEVLAGLEESAVDYVRLVAWAFLNAWTLRYGGLHERMKIRNTFIDPNA